MVQAGRDLWRLSNPASCPKQASSRGKSSCSGLWAEGGESTDSLIPCFSNFPSFIVKMFFFLYILAIVVSHPFILQLQEYPGFFFAISFQVWKVATKFLLKLFTPRLNIPRASSLSACHADGHLPRMSAIHVTSHMCHIHTAANVDLNWSSSDTLGYVWALNNVGQIQKHIYTFFSPDFCVSLCQYYLFSALSHLCRELALKG